MSDSNTRPRGGLVFGTAGHIDHGKTSLVRALTGVDTDRLAEEKRRGISIDLGFAHLSLPDGSAISFVDVPGHERFIRNMLAGAAGISAVLLIIAANEGIKPQTREHFEICRLLGVTRGVIVLTKCDLVSEAELDGARAAARQLVAGSFLSNAPILAASAVTGAGLDELRALLANLDRTHKHAASAGFARLAIDRSFALKGFGTVVTGTLSSGTLRTGETIAIHPLCATARIRGLQVHGVTVEQALAGERTAVNLSGIEHTALRRGLVLASAGPLAASRRVHASLQLLRGFQIFPREEFLFHSGTAETPARVKTLAPGFAEIHLAEPLLVCPGDHFVLRRPSPSETVGGGKVIDAFPPRLSRPKTVARLERLAESDLTGRTALLIEEKPTGRSFKDIVRLTGQPLEGIRAALAHAPGLVIADAAQRVVSKPWLDSVRQRILTTLEHFHRQHPSSAGAPLPLLRTGLDSALAQLVFSGIPNLRISGDVVALASHQPQVSREEAAELARIEHEFRAAGYQPPAPTSFARAPLERLVKAGKLIRIAPDLVFHADVLAHIRRSLAAQKGRRFSVPEFKQWTQVSRKYAIPLLEFLDHQHVTKRDGDHRIVL